jgi:hypothetical protein
MLILQYHNTDQYEISYSVFLLSSSVTQFIFVNMCPVYCTSFDQRVARKQLCKHGPTRNNRWGCVVYVVRAEQRWNNGVKQAVSTQRLGKHTSA